MTLYSTRWASFIRGKRTRYNLSLAEFAMMTGVHPQYISQMERGRVPTWETVREMWENFHKRFPQEDISDWFINWADAHLEDLNLSVDQIIHPENKAPNFLPIELESSLRRILTNRKIYPIAVRILAALAEE